MSVYTEVFDFETREEFDIVDLTDRVEAIVKRAGIQEGIAVVFAGHATGIILLNEYEHRLMEDLREFLRRLIPEEEGYHHPANAYAHLRSMIFTPSRVVPVHDGSLALGTWQSLFWVEAESRPRRRRVEVTVIGR